MNSGALNDLWSWWCFELLGAFNHRDKPRAKSAPLISVTILRDSCIIERLSKANREVLEGTSYDRVGERTKVLTNANSCEVVISEGRYLSRHLSAAKLPFSRAYQMAAIDLADGTPFEIDDVHICVVDDTTAETSYSIIRRDVLDPVIDSLVGAGVRPTRIALKTPDGEDQLSRQSLKSIHPAFRRKSWQQRLQTASLGLLAVAAVATFGHVYYRYAEADARLSAQVEEKQKSALEVRKLLDRRAQDIAAVEAARKSKAQAVPVVQVWDELTKTLPDSAWITDLALNGDSLSFSGFAGSAAGLISTLDASALFADPSFTAPVVRIPGQAGERFAIKLSVVRQ